MTTQLIREASARQDCAADVGHSVWVSANAGTGKTHVLTKRILRLLMEDHQLMPSEILAVTYTNVAAREMAVRLREKVAEWQSMADEDLLIFLKAFLAREVTNDDLARARQLFPLMLDTPVNTSTIHGLCQQVLAKFPLEAGLSPGFSLVEDSAPLLAEAQADVFFSALKADYAWAFEILVNNMADSTLGETLSTFVSGEQRYRALMRRYGGVDALLSELAEALDVPQDAYKNPQRAEEQLREQTLSHHRDALDALAEKLDGAGANATKYAAFMRARDLASAFLKKDGAPVSASYAVPKKVAHLRDEYLRLQEVALYYVDRLASLRSYVLTAAYLTMGDAVAKRYKDKKRGNVDFDDLIVKTAFVLKYKDWVRYKLDGRTVHVLLDEAQDTNAEQWSIVQSIVDEFYYGEQEKPRTFFAVGDLKQSIFRFSGAQPHVFSGMRDYLQAQPSPAHVAELVASFRSTEVVLNFVDKVFEAPHRAAALGEARVEHTAIREGSGGVIEIWPLVEPSDGEEKEPWQLPTSRVVKHSVKADVADQIAQHIEKLLQCGDVLETTGRPVSAGDVLILLRSRTLMPALVNALDARGIPNSGADRLNLLDDLIVQDLLALVKYVTNPSDRLSLFQVLRSPMFGYSSEQLMTANGSPLQPFVEASKKMSPYGLVVHMLTSLNARGAYYHAKDPSVKRAHSSVDDVIDAFLERLLTWQTRRQGTLLGFIDAFEKEEQELSRQITSESGVRILTAHGSKGLEAPIVYMPDSSKDFYKGLSKEKVLWQVGDDESDTLCVLKRSKNVSSAFENSLMEAEKERIFKDEMRLLYVALTRAKERLYISGENSGKHESSWYHHILDAVDWEPSEDGVLRHVVQAPVDSSDVAAERPLDTQMDALPHWARMAAEAERPIHAVQGADLDGNPLDMLGDMDAKLFRRGRLVHKLLEVLPQLPAEERLARARFFMAQHNGAEEDAEQACAIIEAYPELFGSDSRAEVELSVLRGGQRLEGKVDRLIVRDDDVIVLDFKTNKDVPQEMPGAYRRQLLHYVQAASTLFPQKNVRAAVLWVTDASLMWL